MLGTTKITQMPQVDEVLDSDIIPMVQGENNVRATIRQILDKLRSGAGTVASAKEVKFDNSSTTLGATNVQDAITELVSYIDTEILGGAS